MINDRFLPIEEVRRIAGNKSRRTIYRWMDLGVFPKSIEIGPNSVAWSESAIKGWVEAKKQNAAG
ncbi:MAG: AlpA family phage regulatory protein [Gammaproteobacteria bacterium]|nr:AlpA family phage regulatory protein [Gammaproteobacteria bacterium]